MGSSIWQWSKSSEHQSEGLFEKRKYKNYWLASYSSDLLPPKMFGS